MVPHQNLGEHPYKTTRHFESPGRGGQGHGRCAVCPSSGWRHPTFVMTTPFTSHIIDKPVTFTNPKGTITIIDLELAASIAQHDVLAQHTDVREATIHNLSHSMVMVWWQGKGVASTMGPWTRLLHLQALYQWYHRYTPLFDYIPGTANAMADDISRRLDLSDSQLLAYFNLVYPQS
jgi:hypothetical protein